MHQKNTNILELIHDHHIRWKGNSGVFSVLGSLSMDSSSLRVSVHIERTGIRKQRLKLDLYDYEQITRHATHLSEREGFEYAEIESDFLSLTELLEHYRELLLTEQYQAEHPPVVKRLSLSLEKEYVERLSSPDLLSRIGDSLGQIGIAGEETNRLLLFIIATSYKHEPLHAVIQSGSGSGKSHLINTIASCIPEEDLLSLSRITSKSLYHFKGDMLRHKLIIIQDFDGLDTEALFAFRELQSFGQLTTSLTGKDVFGNHSAKLHTVHGHFASIGASTKPLYTDNASRSMLLTLDESAEQTKRILCYQKVHIEQITQIQADLKHMISLLTPKTVINPYTEEIQLPHTVPMARRINRHLKNFIEQITFLHQYQRSRDEQGRIITTREDVERGIELFSSCLSLSLDELEPTTRHFFEQLKVWIKTQQENSNERVSFSQREIRHALGIPKTTLQRSLKSLMELEYLEITAGTAHTGYRYAISFTDTPKNTLDELMKGFR